MGSFRGGIRPVSGQHIHTNARVRICNKLGLHIRPSRQVAELARSFDAEITVQNMDRLAAADSQLDLLMLLATNGTMLEISATGPQAADAVSAIVNLVEARFGECS